MAETGVEIAGAHITSPSFKCRVDGAVRGEAAPLPHSRTRLLSSCCENIEKNILGPPLPQAKCTVMRVVRTGSARVIRNTTCAQNPERNSNPETLPSASSLMNHSDCLPFW